MRGEVAKRIKRKIEEMDPDILLKIRNLHGEQTKMQHQGMFID